MKTKTSPETWKRFISTLYCLCFSIGLFAKPGIEILKKDKNETLKFIANKGQWVNKIKYKASINGGTVFLTDKGFTYDYYDQNQFNEIAHLRHEGKSVEHQKISHHAFNVNLLNANSNIKCTPSAKFPNYNNYFIGNDSTKWAGKVGIYGQVYMSNVYNGIDLSVYGKGADLKYDFRVNPGSDPSLIQLSYEGVNPVLTHEGHLLIKTNVNEIRELAPFTFQWVDGKQKHVASRYSLKGNQLSFQILENYDKTLPLIIDPQLEYSTYSGATAGSFSCMSTTYDAAGSLYVVTDATHPDGWPTTPGAYETTVTVNGGICNAINKYSANGSALVYSTYIGGAADINVNTNSTVTTAQNELIITGSVEGNGYPVTAGAFDNTFNGETDIFITKFNADGSAILQSTFVGGNDVDAGRLDETSMFFQAQTGPSLGWVLNAVDIQIDDFGTIWIVSSTASADFPVSPNAFQPTFQGGNSDGVIFALNSTLNTLLYSSYLGGNSDDALKSLTIVPNGNIAVCGVSNSNNIATTPNAIHATYIGGDADGYACIINPATGAALNLSYIGTNAADNACKIQSDANNNIYILGRTDGSYPVSPGAYNIANGSLFIDKLNSTLTTSLASTRTGFAQGTQNGCNPTAFLVDKCGTVYLSCIGQFAVNTFPPIMPVTPNALIAANRNYWCAALNNSLNSLEYATYFGSASTGGGMNHQHQGTAHFNPDGILYQSICSRIDDNPGTQGSWSPQKQNDNNRSDAFSFKINFELAGVNADFSINPATNNGNDTGCAPLELTFINNSTANADYIWDFGDGSPTTNIASPTHIFQVGEYDVKLIAVSNTSAASLCHGSDTAILHIVAQPGNKPLITLNDTFLCNNNPINVSAIVSNITPQSTFRWEPAAAVLSNNGLTATIDPSVSTDIMLFVSNGPTECDSASETMHITLSDVANARILPGDTIICPGDTILLTASGGNSYMWNSTYNIDVAGSPAIVKVWPAKHTLYMLTITDTNNCQNHAYANVRMLGNADVDAGRDIDIRYGEPTRLNGHATGNFTWQYDVYPAHILRPEVRPLETTTYYLTGRTSFGCLATDSVTVYVTFGNVPSAFSPNGDGLNDDFRLIPNNDRIKLLNFSVYNRWGNRVFYTEDIKDGWDGTYNNKPSDLDVYFYYVNYAIGETNYTFKGDVTLVR